MLPLPLYESRPIGTLADKAGKSFTVVMGLDQGLVAQLKERSLDLADTDLQENSSDYKRFGEGSYETWYAKQRTPFALVDPDIGALAAIAWMGPKPFGRDSAKHLSPEEQGQDERTLNLNAGRWHTISFRSYPGYRGTGFMKAFARMTIDEYKKWYPDAKIWTITDKRNIGSVKLSEAFGLVAQPQTDPSSERLVMAEPD